MNKGLAMNILFWILIFFVVLIVFVALAMWGKKFSLNILKALFGFIP